MAAGQPGHRTLTRAEQARLGARARDAAGYRARARAQAADEGDEAPAGRAAAPATTPSPLGSSRGYVTSGRAGSAGPQPKTARRAAAGDGIADGSPLSRDSAAAHYGARRGGSARRHVARRALVGIALVVGVAAVALGLFVHTINERMSAGIGSDLLAALTGHRGDDPFYMLLLGVDRDAERAAAGGGDYHDFRADTIILARIDARASKVTLVSIPRDTMVELGEHGQQKINAAYSIGGPAYLVTVVRELAGVDVAHYAEVDLDGFGALVDQVGGIDVELPVDVVDPNYTGLDLAAGTHHLDGQAALMLVRTRHAYDAYGAGDYFRAANQRMVIDAVAHKVLASDPLTLAATVSALAEHVTCDLDAAAIVRLAMAMGGSVEFMTGQAPTTSKYVGGVWYEMLETVPWQNMMARVEAGEAPYAEAGDDPTAGVVGIAVTGGGAAAELEYGGTVIVLNATDASGLAGDAAEALSSRGFSASASNAPFESGASMVVYNGDDALPKARAAAEALGLDVEPTANDGTLPADANVVVVLGADRT